MKLLYQLLVLLEFFHLAIGATDKIVCYFGTWATYRGGNGKFEVENIDPTLCTHIIYSFVGLSANGKIRSLDPGYDTNARGLSRFVQLKSRNANVKLLVAIGGWNEGSTVYSNVVNNPTLRSVFVNDVIAYLRENKLDGFDIDWEYPAQRGGIPSDKAAFVQLLSELRVRFDEYGFILSAGVAAPANYIPTSYDVPNMNKYIDFFNIMTYDLRGSYDGITGQHSGLYPSTRDTSATDKALNTDACVRSWIQAGASLDKIVVGVPMYGRTFTLASASNNGVGAPITGPGASGPYTLEGGSLSYLEICEKQKKGGWETVWNTAQQVPYTYSGLQWVGYENANSVRAKAEYAVSTRLGGIMFWSLESEDSRNICGGGFYPLLRAANEIINLNTTMVTTTPKVTTPTPPTTTSKTTVTSPTTTSKTTATSTTTTTPRTTITTTSTAKPTTGSSCPTSGYYLDPADCSAYYRCSPTDEKIVHIRYKCPKTTIFNLATKICVYGTC